MNAKKRKNFAKKHGPDAKPNSLIKEKILKRTNNNELSCTAAFEIGEELHVAVDALGVTADLLNFKMVKCQLGLFGYPLKKQIVQPKNTSNKDLKDAITEALVAGVLPCKSAWDIASRFKVHKLNITEICEFMGIRIKNCQLGAF